MIPIVFSGGGPLPHTTGIVWPISRQIGPISLNRALSARVLMAKVSAHGARPLPAGGGTRRTLLVAPTPPGLRPPPPPPEGAGAVRGDTQGQTLPGHDELLVRTGRTLADCPPTRIQTVFRGGERLTADWPILPQNSLRLLNWAVSSWISIPNVNAYGARPLPARGTTHETPVPGTGQCVVMPGCGAGTRECQDRAKTDRSSLLVSVLVIGNRCTTPHPVEWSAFPLS